MTLIIIAYLTIHIYSPWTAEFSRSSGRWYKCYNNITNDMSYGISSTTWMNSELLTLCNHPLHLKLQGFLSTAEFSRSSGRWYKCYNNITNDMSYGISSTTWMNSELLTLCNHPLQLKLLGFLSNHALQTIWLVKSMNQKFWHYWTYNC